MKNIKNYFCAAMEIVCTAPDTNCPHWCVTFCELDIEESAEKESEKGKAGEER